MLVNEAFLADRVGSPSKVHMFWIRLREGVDVPTALAGIESTLNLGTHAVAIQTEGAVLEQMSQFTGTIRWLIQVVSWIVLVTIWVVTANTIAISTREKRSDVALMKAIGFRPRQVMRWILLESMLLAAAGGGIGTLLGWGLLMTRWVAEALGTVHAYRLTPGILALNGSVALAIGLLSGALPAWTAARWSVVRTIQG
jgi:putative ABC transport system permease protein